MWIFGHGLTETKIEIFEDRSSLDEQMLICRCVSLTCDGATSSSFR